MLDPIPVAQERRLTSEHYWKPLELDRKALGKEPWKIASMAKLAEELGPCGAHQPGSSMGRRKYIQHIELLLDHREKGLMSYKSCSHEELLKFCIQRHIPISEREMPKPSDEEMGEEETNERKGDLMASLLEADGRRTFHRFTELPPELRNLVYHFSFDYWKGFDEDAYGIRSPPPLAQVDRLLRREILPLFYRQENFKVFFGFWKIWEVERADSFAKTAPNLFTHLRSFIFRLELPNGTPDWTVKLSPRGSGHQIIFDPDTGSGSDDVSQDTFREVLGQVDRELRTLVKNAADRVGKNESIELRLLDWLMIKALFKDAQEELDCLEIW